MNNGITLLYRKNEHIVNHEVLKYFNKINWKKKKKLAQHSNWRM